MPTAPFSGDTKIIRLTIPKTIKHIGDNAYVGCVHLCEVYNFSSVEVVPKESSNGCAGLYSYAVHTSDDAPSVIVSDEEGYRFAVTDEIAVYLGNSIKTDEIILPNTIKCAKREILSYTFDKYAFYNENGLKSIYIPQSVTLMPKDLLIYCTSLEKLTLPYIGGYAADIYNSYIGYLFGADSYEYNIDYIPDSLKEITVLSDIIDDFAFYGCKISRVSICSAINIGTNAFYGCTELEYIYISDSLISVDKYAFFGCPIKKVFYSGQKSSWHDTLIDNEGNSTLINAETEYLGYSV